MHPPLFRPVADHALLVEFGDSISPAAHDAVLHLDQALAAAPFPGFAEAIPAFVNLLVDFDPLLTDHAAVERHLRGLLSAPPRAAAGAAPAPPSTASRAPRCGCARRRWRGAWVRR